MLHRFLLLYSLFASSASGLLLTVGFLKSFCHHVLDYSIKQESRPGLAAGVVIGEVLTSAWWGAIQSNWQCEQLQLLARDMLEKRPLQHS